MANTSNPINLKKHDRVKIGTPAEGNHFPKNLSEQRTMVVKVYDTAKSDPNAGLVETASSIAEATKSAFDGKSNINPEEDSGVFDQFLAAGSGLTTGILGVLSSGGNAVATQYAAYNEYRQNFEHFGNVSINANADAWMDNLYLPLPNEITETLSHEYGDENGFMQSGAVIGGLTKGVTGPVSWASNAVSKATGRQHLITNENKLSWFTGSAFRSITLTWTLVPNNKDESKNAQNIITKLKAYSSPQAVAGRLLLRAPFYCKLEFANEVIQNALQFHECVITDIEVNYSVNGYMETFDDDMPKTMQLSVTFRDREPKTLQAWADPQQYYEDKDKETS